MFRPEVEQFLELPVLHWKSGVFLRQFLELPVLHLKSGVFLRQFLELLQFGPGRMVLLLHRREFRHLQ